MRKPLDDFPDFPDRDETKKRLIMARNQRWESTLLEVPGQEMEHLGIANNMLNAVSNEPYSPAMHSWSECPQT